MRVWDIHPKKLCRNHLLGEHREIHAIWNIITKNKRGYQTHPETNRWRGKLKALYLRHEKVSKEMVARGYAHNSPLEIGLAAGNQKQDEYVNTIEEQIIILRSKRCRCRV